jgi:ParB/RepB/Spo0J family partition protein
LSVCVTSFNRLVLSQASVRRVKAGVGIEELAEDIARRTLLQSLTVRPVLDESGAETGMYEVPAGGRRYRALELLVKQKRLARTAPIPCIVRTGGIAEEDSLAENVRRAPLHPLDQFRAFLALREKGQSEEEIAAAFFVSVAVVRQRLRLAAVSPRLLEVYAEDGMSLEQLMAFTVNPDHARQTQVWEALQHSPIRQPYQIRRLLTENAVRASDKRAQLVGLVEYEAAGGIVLRDLFEADDGGWLQDPALLDRLVAEKLERESEAVRTEGWKWVEVAPEFPYGHTYAAPLGGEVRHQEETGARGSGPKPTDRGDLRGGGEIPRRSMRGWARSRRRWPPSTNGQWPTIPPRSHAPAPLSASTGPAACGSSVATCGRRTRRRWRPPATPGARAAWTTTARRRVPKAARPGCPSRPWLSSRLRRTARRTTRASGRSPTG